MNVIIQRLWSLTDRFPRRSRLAYSVGIFCIFAVVGLVSVFFLGNSSVCGKEITPKEIFRGVTYGCDRIERGEEGSGFVHWVRVDLNAPGIEIYVTPLDPVAVSEGWQYRLQRVGDVVERQDLAVAVNGTLFGSQPRWWLRMSGDPANGVEPVVADGVVSHVWGDAYLLWFDDELTPHLRPRKARGLAEFANAKWGIGGQDFWLRNGSVSSKSSRHPDARTALGVDIPRKILFLAVGTHISPRLIFEKLAEIGAKDGMLIDGGESSSMAIGKGASGIPDGTVYGHWRPVANHFGVRARPIR